MKYFFILISCFVMSNSLLAQKIDIIENFDDNSNGWNLSMDSKAYNLGFISDGVLQIERVNTQNSSLYINQNLKIDVGSAFSVSTLIHSKFKGWGYQGLALKDASSGDYLLFAIDSFGIARGFFHTDEEDVELFRFSTRLVGQRSHHVLEISRLSDQLLFIHNRKVLGAIDAPDHFKGEYSTGFYVSQKQSASIEYLKLRQIPDLKPSEKAIWDFPRKQVTSGISSKAYLKFTINEFYMYQQLSLTVNDVKKDLKILTKGANNLKPYDFSFEIDLVKGMNNIVLEFVDHNGLKFKDHKYILRKEKEGAKLNKALLFASENYINWTDLSNPVRDMDSLSLILSDYYGFEVEVVTNASKDSVMSKLKRASDRAYGMNEQLFVFFAGHGTYDWNKQLAYFVCPESTQDVVDFSSYISLKEVESVLDGSSCENICLMTDICFGGRTRDVSVEAPKDLRRVFLASGIGLIDDGNAVEGHSPFIKEFYNFLVKREKIKNVSLSTWVNSLEGRDQDVILRSFGSQKVLNANSNSFQFILK